MMATPGSALWIDGKWVGLNELPAEGFQMATNEIDGQKVDRVASNLEKITISYARQLGAADAAIRVATVYLRHGFPKAALEELEKGQAAMREIDNA